LRKTVVPEKPAAAAAAPGAPGAAPASQAPAPARPLTAAEYLEARSARIAGLPFTAPAYDDLTRPTVAPFPAACVLHHKDGSCDCYSQQATRLTTPKDLCVQIARHGIFVD